MHNDEALPEFDREYVARGIDPVPVGSKSAGIRAMRRSWVTHIAHDEVDAAAVRRVLDQLPPDGRGDVLVDASKVGKGAVWSIAATQPLSSMEDPLFRARLRIAPVSQGRRS